MVTEFGATSDPQPRRRSQRRSTSTRSAGSTGRGSTTAIPRGAPTSPSSWRTGVCARRPSPQPRHPQAIAGTPLRFSFSPQSDVFDMAYVPNHRVHVPMLIFVPTLGALPARLLRPHERRRSSISRRGSDPLEVLKRPIKAHQRHGGRSRPNAARPAASPATRT